MKPADRPDLGGTHLSIIRVSKHERFVVIEKTGIEDQRLSYKATGLLAYLLSKPDAWSVSSRQLADAKTDGRRAVLGALSELEEAGYLQRQRRQGHDGRWVWDQIIYETPWRGFSTMVHGAVIHARKSAPQELNKERVNNPLTPAERGDGAAPKANPRARGTNPRAVAARERETRRNTPRVIRLADGTEYEA